MKDSGYYSWSWLTLAEEPTATEKGFSSEKRDRMARADRGSWKSPASVSACGWMTQPGGPGHTITTVMRCGCWEVSSRKYSRFLAAPRCSTPSSYRALPKSKQNETHKRMKTLLYWALWKVHHIQIPEILSKRQRHILSFKTHM